MCACLCLKNSMASCFLEITCFLSFFFHLLCFLFTSLSSLFSGRFQSYLPVFFFCLFFFHTPPLHPSGSRVSVLFLPLFLPFSSDFVLAYFLPWFSSLFSCGYECFPLFELFVRVIKLLCCCVSGDSTWPEFKLVFLFSAGFFKHSSFGWKKRKIFTNMALWELLTTLLGENVTKLLRLLPYSYLFLVTNVSSVSAVKGERTSALMSLLTSWGGPGLGRPSKGSAHLTSVGLHIFWALHPEIEWNAHWKHVLLHSKHV